ncbi:type I restriction enzyme endonuclease domain-containing protein [Brachybacterium sp. AOP29-B2-41]|uniref:type I restriction enzyme endonuclease domain-containing protein n=1 Tax=Brachybacterium sp. AOP29-B2-41 TaxID=3457704 RepID=UPI00403337EA
MEIVGVDLQAQRAVRQQGGPLVGADVVEDQVRVALSPGPDREVALAVMGEGDRDEAVGDLVDDHDRIAGSLERRLAVPAGCLADVDKVRSSIKRLLRKYKYPPDQRLRAIVSVMPQMEALVDEIRSHQASSPARPPSEGCRTHEMGFRIVPLSGTPLW